MDSSLSDLIALILLLICLSANAYFAQVETALTASHRGRLERLAEGGDEDAARALALLEHSARPIAMAQAGVTCTSLLMGLGIGLLAMPTFGRFLEKLLPGMEVYLAALILSILVMTALTLLFGDFLPKQVAQQDPEGILMRSHRSIRLITRLTALPSAALASVSRGLLLIVGINPENRASATEDAVKDLMEQGTEDGTFEKAEQDMVDRIFHMSDQTASALMTPRTQIAWIDLAESRTEQLRIIRKELSRVIAIRTIHTLTGVNTLANYTESPKQAFKYLSQGYGFLYALQFTRKPDGSLYFTYAEVKALQNQLIAGTGLWNRSRLLAPAQTVGSLKNIAQQIAERYEL